MGAVKTEVRLEQTRVPFGWLLSILSCSGGALAISLSVGLYTGRLEGRVESAVSKADGVASFVNETREDIKNIDRRLSRMEGAMGLRPDPFKRKK